MSTDSDKVVLTPLSSGQLVEVRVAAVLVDLEARRARTSDPGNDAMIAAREKSLTDAGLCPQCGARSCWLHGSVT